MKPGGNYGDGAVTMHAFPYGSEVKPLKKNRDLPIEVAVIHDYIWTKETGYEGALEEKRLKAWGARLKGYDIALFGDNHKSILSRVNDCTVINPGSFMRRKMDEREYRPCVGLIYNTKEKDNVQRHYLDHSGDIFLEEEQVIKAMSGIGTESFLEELSGLSDAAIDFGDAVKRILDRKKVSDTVKKIILSLVDKKKF